jgi:hypothetical protein
VENVTYSGMVLYQIIGRAAAGCSRQLRFYTQKKTPPERGFDAYAVSD